MAGEQISVCAVKNHTMKTCEGVEGKLHAFLTLAKGEGSGQPCSPAALPAVKGTPVPLIHESRRTTVESPSCITRSTVTVGRSFFRYGGKYYTASHFRIAILKR